MKVSEEQKPQFCSVCGENDKYVPLGWDGDLLMHYQDVVNPIGDCGTAKVFAERDRLKAENERLKTQLPIDLGNFVHLEALQDLFEFACTFYESNYEFAGYSARSDEQTAFLKNIYQKVTKLYWERRLSNMESEG
jgi:hypothetical protein